MTTLESTVTLYRRTVKDAFYKDAFVEFEVRFQNIDSAVFWEIFGALTKKKIPVSDGTVTHTVNSIMREQKNTLSANLVRSIVFDGGNRKQDTYYKKWPLDYPYRIRNPFALSYSVVVSVEKPLDFKFTNNNSAVVRVKVRTEFVLAADGKKWRIDLTVTRQIKSGESKNNLPQMVKKMFKPSMTPQNMRALLGDENLYTYEIEIEYLAETPEEKDDLRPKDVTEAVASVLRLSNPEYVREAVYQAEIFHIAQYAVTAPGLRAKFEHEWGLKSLVPQVIALTQADYAEIYPPVDYYLLDKADGVRAMASVRDGRLLVLAGQLTEMYAPGFSEKGVVSTQAGKFASAVAPVTILDGELTLDSKNHAVFYAFDVLVLKDKDLTKEGYEKRIEALEEAVGVLEIFGSQAFRAERKALVHLTASDPDDLRVQFADPVLKNPPYAVDGKILVKPDAPYRDTISYKWKPLANTTIDFLVRRPPSTVMGTAPYVDQPGHLLHFLFVGITPDMFSSLGLERVAGYDKLFNNGKNSGFNAGNYFPIQFSPSITPMAYLYQHPIKPESGDSNTIDGKVIELRCVKLNGTPRLPPQWELVRIREDRTRELKMRQYYGNNFRIAELTWLNYVFPFPEKLLWEGTGGYFATAKSEQYRAQTAFTSFVKSRRIEQTLSHARWVVDLAIGKGQDYGRYVRANVKNLVGVDRDREALAELVRRKYNFRQFPKQAKKLSTTLYILNADLSDSYKENAAKIKSIVSFPLGGANAAVCNLAVHYFAGNAASLRNFVALCREVVKVDGRVVITCMFGKKVHDLMLNFKTGESWDYREDNVLRHSIKKMYAEDALTFAGQKIGVLLPFSKGEYYEEYLVNTGYLVDLFTKRGFQIETTTSFTDFIADFKARNSKMFEQLSDGDLAFLSLYGELVFRRKK